MNNRQAITKAVKEAGAKIGCYDKEVNRLDKKALEKVIDMIPYKDSTDIDVIHNGTNYVIEMESVDNEIDLYIISLEDYNNKYGTDREPENN